MGDNRELWWTWYIAGYRGKELVSAKAVSQSDAEYVAELFRKDGLRGVQVRNHTAE